MKDGLPFDGRGGMGFYLPQILQCYIYIYGYNAHSIKADLSGASRLNASDLESLKAEIDASGASVATIKVKDELQYDVSGAAKLTYNGNPRIYKSEVSSAGIVKKK